MNVNSVSRRIISVIAMLVASCWAYAQTQSSAFSFLKIPRSSHEAALGGHAVSLPESDPTLIYSNPAILSVVGHRTLGLNVTTWLAGTTVAGAQYCDTVASRSSWAVSARYVGYGVTDMTNVTGEVAGTYSARDISLDGTYSYRLGDNWSGGVTMHALYSRYHSYTSFAMAADLGVFYISPSGLVSAGLTFANIGGQIRPFQDTYETLPFDITAGITWKLRHAPLRLTLTMDNLNRWSASDFYSADGSLKFKDILLRHFNIGADILFTDNIYASVGYSFRNRAELATGSSKGLTGLNVGAGIHLNRMQFGISFGKYQVSTSSFIFNFAINI